MVKKTNFTLSFWQVATNCAAVWMLASTKLRAGAAIYEIRDRQVQG